MTSDDQTNAAPLRRYSAVERREVSADNVAIGIFKVLALLAGAAFLLWLVIPGTVFAWHFWKEAMH